VDYAAAIAAVAWVLYHYLVNRDIRRTLHRIADLQWKLWAATKDRYSEQDDSEHD
jgi:hypothetical protein